MWKSTASASPPLGRASAAPRDRRVPRRPIPNYHLQRAHDSHPLFATVPTITIADGVRAVRLKLWDESNGKMVTFAQARRSIAPVAVAAAPLGAEA